jgi:hypothetical protein
MALASNWKSRALCASDPKQYTWWSYDKDDIAYAKQGCSRCSVRAECFLSAWESDEFYGINGGISEYEFLLRTWKKSKKESNVNWKRTDRDLQKIMREIA